MSFIYLEDVYKRQGLASGLKECKGNERTVPIWGKSPKIGRIRACLLYTSVSVIFATKLNYIPTGMRISK